MSCPDKLYAGDSLEFGVNVPDFPPSDGWTLKYKFAPQFASPAQAPLELTATPNATVAGVAYDYVITASPAETNLVPGRYSWWRWVEDGSRVQTLDDMYSRGQLVVLPNPRTATQGTDNRTEAQRALEDARAAYAAFISSKGAVAEYAIGDRRIRFKSAEEIKQQISYWSARVADETAIAQGRAPGPLGRISFGVPNG